MLLYVKVFMCLESKASIMIKLEIHFKWPASNWHYNHDSGCQVKIGNTLPVDLNKTTIILLLCFQGQLNSNLSWAVLNLAIPTSK